MSSSNERGEPQTPTGVRHSARNRTPPSGIIGKGTENLLSISKKMSNRIKCTYYVRACAKTSRVAVSGLCAVCNLGLLLVRKIAQGSRIGILAAAVSRVRPSMSVC